MEFINLIIAFLVCILIGFIIFILTINIFIVRKPNDKDWKKIIGLKVHHFTTLENARKINMGDGYIHLKASKTLISKCYNWFRPSVYFFIDDGNTTKLMKYLNIKNSEHIKIIVEVSDLDKKNIRLRRYDNVLIYTGDYRGKGKIYL